MKAYKFRIYPNKTQKRKLLETFNLCRFTYNKLLEVLMKQEKINRGEIQHHIVELKKEYFVLKNVYSKTLQYECYRLFSNLKGLSRSKKKGNKIGRLRFKGRNWFKTIQYNQSGFKLVKRENKRYNRLHLSKIGEINIVCHRRINGKIKQITIKKKVDSWYAIIITDERYTLKKGKENIGLDMGIINFYADSNGNKVDNPLFLQKSLEKIKQTHRTICKRKKGSKNRRKAINKLLKNHEKINNQRTDFFHKVTTRLINRNKMIAIENLNIKSMINKLKGSKYHNKRNTLDSSWGKFISMLKFKAESAGTEIIEVNPWNTSKMCSNCDSIQDMPVSNREYNCNECDISIDRDYNSAINILRIASVRGFVETEVTKSMKQKATSSTTISS